MIVVPYALCPTPHGLGVFSQGRVLRGQAVYRRNPTFSHLLPLSQFDDLPPAVRGRMLSYTYLGKGEHRRAGWAYFDADDSRFLNHSDTPNIIPLGQGDVYLAARDIEAEEELRCDYRDFSEEGDASLAFLSPCSVA